MECEICGQEVDNSVDLERHMERLHPVSDRDDSQLEKPDLMGDPVEEPEKTPEPAQKRR